MKQHLKCILNGREKSMGGIVIDYRIFFVQLDHKKVPKMQFFFWGQNLPRLPFVGLKYMGEDGFTINTQNDRFQ